MCPVGVTSQDETVGRNVRLFRERMGLSQAELAREMTDAGMDGFYPQTVLKVEKGTRSLKLVEGIFMAQLLGVTADELYEPSPNLSPSHRGAMAMRRLFEAFDSLVDRLVALEVAQRTIQSIARDYPEQARAIGATPMILSREEALRRADGVQAGEFAATGAYYGELAKRAKADEAKVLKAADRG